MDKSSTTRKPGEDYAGLDMSETFHLPVLTRWHAWHVFRTTTKRREALETSSMRSIRGSKNCWPPELVSNIIRHLIASIRPLLNFEAMPEDYHTDNMASTNEAPCLSQTLPQRVIARESQTLCRHA